MVLLPTACKTEGEELAVWLEITAADGKSLSDTTIESSPQGEVIEITIASNTAWRISTSAEWIVPQQSSGERSQSVMLEVGTTTQSRSGVVVVQLAEAEQVHRSFNIVQHAEGPEGPEDNNEGAGDNGSEDSGDNKGGSDDIVMTPDGTDDEGGSDNENGSDDSGNEGSTDNEDGTDNDGSNDDNTDDSDSSPDDDIVMTPDDPSDSGDTDDSEGNGNTDNGESKEDDAEDSDGGNDSTGTGGSDDKKDSEDNNDPNNPDNNQGDNEDSGSNNGGGNGNGSNNGGEGGNGNGNEDNNENNTPVGDYTLIDHVGELAAGEYFIGGYQDDVLHLATEGMTVGHCNTTPYTLAADFSLTPAADATATTIYLEPSDEANGYYIRFSTQGYLTATAAGAGKLTFSNSRSHFWRFANHPDGGFILTQSGDIDVKLIISPHARINALLRSVAGEEDGNAVLLFKRNNP